MPQSKVRRSKNLHKAVEYQVGDGIDQKSASLAPLSDANLLPELRPSWRIQQKAATRTLSDSEPERSGDPLAGAWFATYGTHVSRAIAQQSAAEFLPEVVIGQDDRVRITNTHDYPYSAICSLEITASTGAQYVGTGWLASDDTVITAGHCVFMPEQGGWAKRIRVYPGRNGAGLMEHSYDAISFRSVEGWTKKKRPAADYAAIRLSQKVSGSGRFGYIALRSEDLLRKLYHVVGYSADKTRGTLWGHARPLKDIRDDVLFYETDTYGGNSGGPVFFQDDEEDIYVVGIHNYGDISGNSATRITEDVFDNIHHWIR